MGKPAVDTEELLERLRKEHLVLRWEPLAPDSTRNESRTDQARSAESLSFINANWQLPDRYQADPAIRGLKARIVAAFGRLTFAAIGPYLKSERDFLAHLVRINNALEARCDELTLRCEELNRDMLARQAAEARNLTKLAVLLHLDQPDASRPATDGVTAEERP